ncbi:MAG: hypothetical protein IJ652_00600 [Bacteroidales bacterium]|nr:hypothetical protein [Bacteroidales bacterium]
MRKYRVGGHVMAVVLEAPWRFMEYTPAVAGRIAAAAAGEALPVIPTRAGDEVPARTFVQSREELPGNRTRFDLDFSQYEPFRTGDDAEPLFTLHVRGGEPDWLAAGKADGSIQRIMNVDARPPVYYIYSRGGDTLYEFETEPGVIAGTLLVSEDLKTGEYYPKPGFGPYTTMFQVSTSLMMLYTYATASASTLLMHASVIRYGGLANLFLGVSGTGKSTHSRLWLGHIEGCDLVNDDNPVLRVEAGKLYVYGSPWSGKTPCYRNLRVPVRAIVRLDQAPRNEIKRITGLQAYASVIAAASSIRWMRAIMDRITATVEQATQLAACWHLDCLPDQEAAAVCFHATTVPMPD